MMDEISLQHILDGFSAPLNEEQAWAVCYQCASFLETCWQETECSATKSCFVFSGLNCLYLGKDGNISRIEWSQGSQPTRTQSELVRCIGVLIYQALDFGLGEGEEHALSPDLEALIEAMTDDQGTEDGEKDEGIEEEDEVSSQNMSSITLQDVMQLCVSHLPAQSQPSSHYKAVCRALVTESIELTTFLEAISTNKSRLKSVDYEEPVESEEIQLEQLQRADWARLWMQVMRELRSGRKSLKKVEVYHEHHASYELTPYEALMKDIKDKKYQLKQVMVNGELPPRTRQNAHDLILEFIRSRPPLHPPRERKCQRSPLLTKPLEPREQLLESIRTETPKLKPTPTHQRRTVETSRTKLNDADEKPLPTKKVIQPEASIKFSNFSDSEDNFTDSSSDEEEMEARNKVEAVPFSPISPLSPSASPAPIPNLPSQWAQTVLHARARPLTRSSSVSCSRPVVARRSSFHLTSTQTSSAASHTRPSPSPLVSNGSPASSNGSPLRRGPRLLNSHRNSIVVCESPHYEPKASTRFTVHSRDETSQPSPHYNSSLPASPRTSFEFFQPSLQQPRIYPRSLKRTNSTVEVRTSRPRSIPRSSIKRSPSCVDNRVRSYVTVPEVPEIPNIDEGAGTSERLSLTLEEVKHIRTVLTKAELETLLVRPDLYEQVAKGNVCFTCLKTKFSLFGAWATKCGMCNRKVCSKCVNKMNIPAERFENIPVYTLSPSQLKNSTSKDDLLIYDKTGSAPNSPESQRKSNGIDQQDSRSTTSSESSSSSGKPRRKIARAATMRQNPAVRAAAVLQMKGTEMSLCRDCNAMIVNIIKSTRASRGASALIHALGMSSGGSSPCSPLKSPASSVSSGGSGGLLGGRGTSLERSASERAPTRPNFRLDLKPVYKAAR